MRDGQRVSVGLMAKPASLAVRVPAVGAIALLLAATGWLVRKALEDQPRADRIEETLALAGLHGEASGVRFDIGKGSGDDLITIGIDAGGNAAVQAEFAGSLKIGCRTKNFIVHFDGFPLPPGDATPGSVPLSAAFRSTTSGSWPDFYAASLPAPYCSIAIYNYETDEQIIIAARMRR